MNESVLLKSNAAQCQYKLDLPIFYDMHNCKQNQEFTLSYSSHASWPSNDINRTTIYLVG